MHLIALHDSAGSGNPLGVSGNYDKLPFAPYFIFKDLITIYIFILMLSLFVFFMPNFLGDSENYVMANPMQTPPAIVPEWYLLPFYAILRSIPNKLLGVIAMFSAILILLTMPFTDLSKFRGIQFRPMSRAAFFIFIGNFLVLMQLGAKHVESPFIEFGQISTVLYFAHFLIIVPFLSLFENSLLYLETLYNEMSGETYIVSERPVPVFTWDFKPFGNPLFVNKVIILFVRILFHFFLLSIIIRICLIFCFNMLASIYIRCYSYSPRLIEYCDAPRPWGVYFQDSASPQMEGLVELHDNILFYLVIILFAVGWTLVSLARTYSNLEFPLSQKNVSHGTLVELIWTITPALILMFIAFPSFKLLYLMDEVSDPSMAVLAEGHQWYWSYMYPDFLNSDDEFIEFDSYLIPESDLEEGALRMLEVDNRVIIPELTHVRFIVTGADVIHSFACPALGIKCDAYPGRLNQMSVLINRQGTFYGLEAIVKVNLLLFFL